jgi:hypothetical protein
VPEPEASGRAFLGLISHVKRERGLDFLRETVAASPAATQRVFASSIRATDWHPYEAYAGLLRHLDRALGSGDGRACRELGAVAGERDLGAFLRVYVALASAERLIRSCERVWSGYYRHAGTMQAISWAPEDTRLRIVDFPSMSTFHCRLMEGWMMKTMETIGFRVGPGARETECVTRGGAFHEFACTWTKAR